MNAFEENNVVIFNEIFMHQPSGWNLYHTIEEVLAQKLYVINCQENRKILKSTEFASENVVTNLFMEGIVSINHIDIVCT